MISQVNEEKIKNDMKYIDYVSLSNYIDNLTPDKTNGLKKLKIAFLRSFTLETIKPIFRVEAYKNIINVDLFIGGYNQYFQEIIDTDSELYAFNPDIVVIAVRLEEVFPELINDFLDLRNNLHDVENDILYQYTQMIENIKKNLNCNILVHNFMIPITNYTSLYDIQNIDGQVNVIRKINFKLVKLVSEYSGVYIVDIENLSGIIGKNNIIDKKMWYISKNPYNHKFYIALAKEYVRYIKAIYGMKKKCVVLDLDNTLWGGVVGEGGIDGIKLGEVYPGKCFKDFQMELLKLKNRGIILAICSKNNYEDAVEVLDKHPDMILRKDDFVSLKINWRDKASNIKEISEELNIGLESMVFIDDNPAECELIRQKLPEVTTINLPKRVVEYPSIIANLNLFEIFTIADEDKNKTEMYKSQIKRKGLKEMINNLEEYYKSLEMSVEIKEADEFSIARIAQLTQKTNQFNLTTKRYTEEQIKKLINGNNYLIYYIRVKDKFGDNGIVGVCIVQKISLKEWLIDTLLLSCRVMNRNIENAFIAFIYEQAKKSGVEKIIGKYITTKKNKPVEFIYEKLGFKKIAVNEYSLNVNKTLVQCPDYIEIISKL